MALMRTTEAGDLSRPARWGRAALEALDTLAGVLLSPSPTLAQASRRRPVALSLLTALSVAVVTGLVLVPSPPELFEDILDLPKGTLTLWSILPLWVALFMAVLSLQAAFVHLAAAALRDRSALQEGPRDGPGGPFREPCAGPREDPVNAPGEPAGPREGPVNAPGEPAAPRPGPAPAPRGGLRGIFCGLCLAYLPGLFAAPLIMLRALLASNRANAAYQVAFPLFCLWVFFLGVTAIRHNYSLSPARAAAVGALAFAALVVLPMVAAALIMTRAMG